MCVCACVCVYCNVSVWEVVFVSVYSCVRVCTRLSLSLSILYMYAYVCVRDFFFLDLFMSLTFSAYIPTQMEETERYSVPTEEDAKEMRSHKVLCMHMISDLRCVVVQCCSVVQCVAMCCIIGAHRGRR